MNLYKQFETNDKLEADGIWIEYGFTDDDKPVRVLIARSGGSNTKYAKTLDIKTKPYRRQIQNNTFSEKIAEKIMLDTFSETCVLKWENVAGPDGKLIKFSVANVKKVLGDLPDFYDDLREAAGNASLFRTHIQEVDEGN